MDATKPISETVAATPEQISAALKEYEAANDRVACLAKYPFLVKVLNNAPKKKK